MLAFFNLLKTLKSLISESSLDNWEEFMIKGVIKKIEVTEDKDHTQELNPLNGVYLLWYQMKKLKWLLKANKCVCAQSVIKITMRKFKDTKIFINEVNTQYEKNHSGAAKPMISTI